MRTCLECHTENAVDAQTCVACGGGSFPERTIPENMCPKCPSLPDVPCLDCWVRAGYPADKYDPEQLAAAGRRRRLVERFFEMLKSKLPSDGTDDEGRPTWQGEPHPPIDSALQNDAMTLLEQLDGEGIEVDETMLAKIVDDALTAACAKYGTTLVDVPGDGVPKEGVDVPADGQLREHELEGDGKPREMNIIEPPIGPGESATGTATADGSDPHETPRAQPAAAELPSGPLAHDGDEPDETKTVSPKTGPKRGSSKKKKDGDA